MQNGECGWQVFANAVSNPFDGTRSADYQKQGKGDSTCISALKWVAQKF
jgi:hypothetical protein